MTRRRHRRTSAQERAAILAIAVASGIGGALAPCHPTGLAAADVLLRSGLAVAVALASSRSRRWSWLVTAAVAMSFAQGWWLLVACVGMAGAFSAGFMSYRWRPLGVAVGAISVQALLRLPVEGPVPQLRFHGATALVAAVGVLPVLASGYRHGRAGSKRIVRYALGATALVVVGFVVVFTASTIAAKSHVEDGITSSRQALQAAGRGDAARAERLLDTATVEFEEAHDLVGAWWVAPVRVIPVLSYQAEALDAVTAEGATLARTARATVRTGNYHDLRYQSGAFNLGLVRRIRGPLAQSTAALRHARRTVDGLDSPWLASPLRSRIDDYRADLVDASDDAETANRAAAVLPGLLGGDGPRRYLVLFTTPSEQRGLGGFIGDYAELDASGGKVRMGRSGPIDELIQGAPPGTRKLLGPADYLARYGQYQIADYFQDLTLSPDFPSVASVASQLYPQSGGAPVDGVIAVDPYGLQALLTFTGPIHVDGLDGVLTKDNAAEILLKDQYLTFGRDDERSDWLQEATRVTFEKLTSGSLPAPQTISRVMSAEAHDGHFLMWSPNAGEERFFEGLHAAGALPRPDGGDFLAVRAQNSAHNKIDIYLRRNVTYQARFNPGTGQVDATATITFTNDAPAGGLPDYVIGNTVNLPLGSNRMNVSVYSPLSVEQATLDGKAITLSNEQELGWQVHSVPMTLSAGQTRTLVVHLRGKLAPGAYHLQLAPQTAVNPESDAATVDAGTSGRIERKPEVLTRPTRIDATG